MTQNERINDFVLARCQQAVDNAESDVFAADCDIIEFMLDNCGIYMKPGDVFFPGVMGIDVHRTITSIRNAPYEHMIEENGLAAGERAFAFSGQFDFSHTSPVWEDVIHLGIFGLRERARDHLVQSENDLEKSVFFRGLLQVYDGALRLMARCADFARNHGKAEMSDHISALTRRSPINLYEAMQTTIIFYTLQLFFDRTNPRTMGRCDSLFYNFAKNEAPDRTRELVRDYVKTLEEFRAGSNLPFALGGTDERGNSCVNELSHLFLEEYRKLRPANVKIHALISKNTPIDFIEKAMDSVREGSNSIVFLSDEKVIESLILLGEDPRDAIKYHVVGCYECGGNEELTCSCNARVNIPKALEYALNNGVDMMSSELIGLPTEKEPESFEEFFKEFCRQLTHLCECAMTITDLWEEKNPHLHSSPFFSSSYVSAMKNGGDLYCKNTAKYPNSSVNAIGLATAANSLYAIKKIVFEDRELSLGQLSIILRSNWKDHEILRLRCKNRLKKFGNGDREVDTLAKRIVKTFTDAVWGRPNKKGGKYRPGLFSIDWKWAFGKHSAASADGRLAGEVLSQNTSATAGTSKQGATAHLMSVASLDSAQTPNGSIVDIDLHGSAVSGDNGLSSMVSSLIAYFELGGFALQYNVLDTTVLEDARKFPEKYPDLQVRLCGWNVLFSSLSDREKEEFIIRSMSDE